MTNCRCLSALVALGFLTVCAAPSAEAAAQAEEKCPKIDDSCSQIHTTPCHYEFTIQEDKGSGSLDVKISGYSFAVTEPKRNDQNEKDHVKKVKDKIYSISTKPGVTVKKNNTYAFTRCPDSLYAIGDKVDPKRDPTKP